MDCPYVPELGFGEFGKRLREAIGSQRIPVSGSAELTFQCNLRCKHCYLDGVHDGIAGQQELTTQEWYDIFDQLADAGTLWLLLTGGEPLVRHDFLDIYTYAKRKGFLITLFTNGTLLTPEIADYLAEWPPHKVEISLYGRTQRTYEGITGIPGSYKRCMQGIDLLLERNIPLDLKTVLMTLNQDELEDMKVYAESLGVGFRFDPMINAGVEGASDPTIYRLSPEEIVQFDVNDEKRSAEYQEFCERFLGLEIDRSSLYVCGAGVTAFNIDPYGQLGLCLVARSPSYDLRQGAFREGWGEFLPKVRYQEVSEDYKCNQCELLSLCGQCPGWAQMENNDPEVPVDFLCEVAHLRWEAFGVPKLL